MLACPHSGIFSLGLPLLCASVCIAVGWCCRLNPSIPIVVWKQQVLQFLLFGSPTLASEPLCFFNPIFLRGSNPSFLVKVKTNRFSRGTRQGQIHLFPVTCLHAEIQCFCRTTPPFFGNEAFGTSEAVFRPACIGCPAVNFVFWGDSWGMPGQHFKECRNKTGDEIQNHQYVCWGTVLNNLFVLLGVIDQRLKDAYQPITIKRKQRMRKWSATGCVHFESDTVPSFAGLNTDGVSSNISTPVSSIGDFEIPPDKPSVAITFGQSPRNRRKEISSWVQGRVRKKPGD